MTCRPIMACTERVPRLWQNARAGIYHRAVGIQENNPKPTMATKATIVSVNVAVPTKVRIQDTVVLTSIFKEPVEGRVAGTQT